MPYTKDNLPDWVKELPAEAMNAWMKSFNSAFEEYDGDEEKAMMTANSMLAKMGYKKSGDKWVKAKDIIYQFPVELGDANLKDTRFRKQLLRYGKWLYEGAKEGVLEITPDIVKEIVQNFKDKVLENVPVTIDHDDNPNAIVGNVSELIQTDNGLDAIIEIPEEESIVSKIKNRVIKGISASLEPDYVDKETGEKKGWVAWHAAIVGEPYLKGMGSFQELSEFKNKRVIKLKDMITKEKMDEDIKSESDSKKEEQDKKSDTSKETNKEEKKEEEKEEKKEESKDDKKEVLKSKLRKHIEEGQAILTELDTFEFSASETAKKLQEYELKDAETRVDTLIRDKKILPAQKEEVLTILSAKGNRISLADGTQKSIGDVFENYLSKQEKVKFDDKEIGKISEQKEMEKGDEDYVASTKGMVDKDEFVKYKDIKSIDPTKLVSKK